MATGESRRMQYRPGMQRPQSIPVEAGDYVLNMKDYGKPGLAGWTSKQGKFPYRFVTFEILDTVDEQSGGLKTVRTVISVNPKAFFNIFDLAASSQYPEELDLPEPKSYTDMAAIRKLCEWVDNMLGWIKENGVAIPVTLKQREYNGRLSNEVASFNAPNTQLDEGSESTPQAEDEAEDEDEEGSEEEGDDAEPEQVKEPEPEPTPTRASGKGKGRNARAQA